MKTSLIFTLFYLTSAIAKADPCASGSILKTIFTSEDSVGMETLAAPLRNMDKTLIRETQDGKTFRYWVDDQNQIHFSDAGTLPKDESGFVILKDSNTKDGYIVKEWGEFSFDKKDKQFFYKPKNSWDLQPGEIETALKQNSQTNFKRVANPNLQKSRVVKCTDLLAAQERGDTFVKDGLMISGFVTTAGFVTANPEILNVDVNDEQWRKNALLLGSDLTGNITSSYISGRVVKPLITKDVGIVKDFFQRTTTDFATNAIIKRPIYNAVNAEKDENGEKSKIGNQLLPYDTAYGVVRFFPKRALQKWTIRSLPKILLSSCLQDSKLNLIVGPRMVRLADQYVAGYFYMAGRKAWLSEPTEKKQEE